MKHRSKPHATSPGHRLTSKQLAAIPLLIGGADYSEVATKLGVRRETVGRWQLDPRFARALHDARTRAFSDSVTELRATALAATRTLRASLGSDDEHVRVRSATAVLRLVLPTPDARSAAEITAPEAPLDMTRDEVIARLGNAVSALIRATSSGTMGASERQTLGALRDDLAAAVDAKPRRMIGVRVGSDSLDDESGGGARTSVRPPRGAA